MKLAILIFFVRIYYLIRANFSQLLKSIVRKSYISFEVQTPRKRLTRLYSVELKWQRTHGREDKKLWALVRRDLPVWLFNHILSFDLNQMLTAKIEAGRSLLTAILRLLNSLSWTSPLLYPLLKSYR